MRLTADATGHGATIAKGTARWADALELRAPHPESFVGWACRGA